MPSVHVGSTGPAGKTTSELFAPAVSFGAVLFGEVVSGPAVALGLEVSWLVLLALVPLSTVVSPGVVSALVLFAVAFGEDASHWPVMGLCRWPASHVGSAPCCSSSPQAINVRVVIARSAWARPIRGRGAAGALFFGSTRPEARPRGGWEGQKSRLWAATWVIEALARACSGKNWS